VGAALILERASWGAGLVVSRSFELASDNHEGSGRSTVTRLAVAVRRRLAGQAARGLSLWGTLEAGADHVRTNTRLDAPDPTGRTVSALVPTTSAGLLVTLALGPRWQIGLATRASVFLANTRILVRGAEVYDSGWIEPSFSLAIRARI
jgi:hypothetical protein